MSFEGLLQTAPSFSASCLSAGDGGCKFSCRDAIQLTVCSGCVYDTIAYVASEDTAFLPFSEMSLEYVKWYLSHSSMNLDLACHIGTQTPN